MLDHGQNNDLDIYANAYNQTVLRVCYKLIESSHLIYSYPAKSIYHYPLSLTDSLVLAEDCKVSIGVVDPSVDKGFDSKSFYCLSFFIAERIRLNKDIDNARDICDISNKSLQSQRLALILKAMNFKYWNINLAAKLIISNPQDCIDTIVASVNSRYSLKDSEKADLSEKIVNLFIYELCRYFDR